MLNLKVQERVEGKHSGQQLHHGGGGAGDRAAARQQDLRGQGGGGHQPRGRHRDQLLPPRLLLAGVPREEDPGPPRRAGGEHPALHCPSVTKNIYSHDAGGCGARRGGGGGGARAPGLHRAQARLLPPGRGARHLAKLQARVETQVGDGILELETKVKRKFAKILQSWRRRILPSHKGGASWLDC